MIAPNQGPCVCDDLYVIAAGAFPHEHAEFEPYACADCDCDGWRPPRNAGADSNAQPQNPPGEGCDTSGAVSSRPAAVTIPAELDFSQERVTDTAQHLDQIITQIRGTFTDPDDPLAVCALADILETNWPDHADPWVALVLATRRLIDATNHARPRRAAALDAIRRKVQR